MTSLNLTETLMAVFRLMGWLPGDYKTTCVTCKTPVLAAKGASCCAACAEKGILKVVRAHLLITQALGDYHAALDAREHGGLAADKLVKSLEDIFESPWVQGKESGRRAEIQRMLDAVADSA